MSGRAPPRARDEPGGAAVGLVNLAEAVARCRRNERFLAELERLYEEVDRRAAAGGGRCLGGGACCKFDLFRHRLYLTAGELAMLTRERPKADPLRWVGFSRADGRAPQGLRCPYQVRGRCRAHARRPLGCRVYFCRPADPEAPGRAYEEFHARLVQLHRRFALPYFYAELTAALRDVLPPKPTHRNGSVLGSHPTRELGRGKTGKKSFTGAEGELYHAVRPARMGDG